MQGVPGETLTKVLPNCPRPVVIVPNGPSTGDAIVIAYDGSLQAARTLHAFEATGLGAAREVHVVTINPNRAPTARVISSPLTGSWSLLIRWRRRLPPPR
jgi:hypothetical protein